MKFGLFAGSFLASIALATDFYLSPDGSDSNAGTSASQAFKTVTKAKEAVRAQLGKSLTEDVNVHIAAGIYTLTGPLNFTSADSGKDGHKVNWLGEKGSIVSGGLKVTGWTAGNNGIYSASVPAGTQSRNLFVGGKAANYARRKIANRKDFSYTTTSMKWNSGTYDWLMNTKGIAGAEVRFISSFTDRYAPIVSVGNRELVMKQNSWSNQIIGWDTVSNPFADFGVWVQNSLALLTEGGQFFLDSQAGKVYYKPLGGEDLSRLDTYLGVQEVLISISGSYDDLAHDINFEGLTFSHSTWLRPGKLGFADQQTGGYIGEDKTYPEHEATRPFWWQMPSAFQISAATKVNLTGCSFTEIGNGGIGVGNDPNAHLSKVGLGASDISITDGYFTQVMGNSISVGGIQAEAHHPSNERRTVTRINISGNIFTNNSALFSSTVPIFLSYLQYSTVSHNDIFTTPYSGICHGYGWGSNDAGGSQEYVNRGLYKYQPKYSTPTTLKNNVIDGNLVHSYGQSHTDLGGVYTLSTSPSTYVTNNYVYDSGYWGLYNDEGSNSYIQLNNLFFGSQGWYVANRNGPTHTGNNTLVDNYGKSGQGLDGKPNGSGTQGDTYLRNYIVSDVTKTSAEAQKNAYRSGVLPGRRAGRPVTNDARLADGWVSLVSAPGGGGGRLLAVNVSNFDDVAYTGASFQVRARNGGSLRPVDVPTAIPANAFALATYSVSGSSNPSVAATVKYTNPRLGAARTLTASGQVRLG